MDVLKAIKERRSVRSFEREDDINEEYVDLILEAAKWAPSAKNLQPLEYIITRDGQIRKELSVACRQNQPEQSPLVISVIGDLNIARRVGDISTHDTTTAERGENMFIYMDAAAAIQNMLLASTSVGIDSLWISSFADEDISRILKIPDEYLPLAVLCFGHRKKSPYSPKKRDMEERTHLEYFRPRGQDLDYLEQCKLINEEKGELKGYRNAGSEKAK